MSGYAILKTQKFHTFNQLYGMQLHNNREIPLEHVDSTKSIQNIELIHPGGTYSDSWHRVIESAESKYNKRIKRAKNSVIAIEVMLTFSHDADIPIKEWSTANVEWLKKTFGEDNILACTLHMDETTPHIHASIIPIDSRGHLCAKSFIDGPYSLKKMQTDYANEMEPFGLERGERRKRAKKKSLYDFYSSINDIDKHPVPEQYDDESNEAYLERLREFCRLSKLAVHNMQLQVTRDNEIMEAKVFEVLKEYQSATDFYQLLLDKYEDVNVVNKRFQDYQQLECAVPRNELDKVLTFLTQKYHLDDNILSLGLDPNIVSK